MEPATGWQQILIMMDGVRFDRYLKRFQAVKEIVPCFKATAPSLALSPRPGKFEHADTGEHCARSEAYVGFFA